MSGDHGGRDAPAPGHHSDPAALPPVGLGTWDLDREEDPGAPEAGALDPAECVRVALEAGYRHVDTAAAYGTEAAVGEGLRRADVAREDVWVATKVPSGDQARDDVVQSARESRERLGLDVIDLLYVHTPMGNYDPDASLPAYAGLRDAGVIRHVAVSNFTPGLLEAALDVLGAHGVPLFAHQVECHPLLHQDHLRAHADAEGYRLVAHTPLIRTQCFQVPELQAVAAKHGASEAQVSLAWLAEKGVAAVPKAYTAAHVRENFAATDLDLDDEDVAAIDRIDDGYRICDWDEGPWNW